MTYITIRNGAAHHAGLAQARELLKLRLRALVRMGATKKWLAFLNSSKLYKDLSRANPCLIKKIYRAYLDNKMSCSQRISVLIGHYEYIGRIGWGELVLAAAIQPIRVVDFQGKSGKHFTLTVETGSLMEREGELVFRLYWEQALVSSCAFSFLLLETSYIAIGGLQGPQQDGLALSRAVTKELYGLRPKHLMLKLILALGFHMGCEKAYLVSNRNHAVLRSRREGKVFTDYDAFWTECGAALRSDGNFEMCCEKIRAPDLETIQSKRRSAAISRFELLESISEKLLHGLETSVESTRRTHMVPL